MGKDGVEHSEVNMDVSLNYSHISARNIKQNNSVAPNLTSRVKKT